MTTGPEPVVAALRARGHRVTAQRLAIVEEALRIEGHISPADLVKSVQAREPGVNASTVYRTLTLLEELGFVSHAHLEGGPEYRVGSHDHVHLLCGECGRHESLPPDAVEAAAAALNQRSGFRADFTHFAIAGVCSECAERG